MKTYSVYIAKIDYTVELSEADIAPSNDFLLSFGLKQKIADCHAGVTGEMDEAKTLEVRSRLDRIVESIKAGTLTERVSAQRKTTFEIVMDELLEAAYKQAVKQNPALRKASKAQIRLSILEKNLDALTAKAEKEVKAREKLGEALDLQIDL